MRSSYTRGMLVMGASSLVFSAMSLLVPFTRSINTSIVTAVRFTTGIAVIGGLGIREKKSRDDTR